MTSCIAPKSPSCPLTPRQENVLRAAGARAQELSSQATARLLNRLGEQPGCLRPPEALTQLRTFLRFRAPLVINFPHSASAGLAKDGCYRNQFETGTSGGKLENLPDGLRVVWEDSLFDQGYHAGDTLVPEERPRYGTVAVDKAKYGAESYGIGMLQLADHVRDRITLTPADSSKHMSASHVGTLAYADHVLLSLTDTKLQAMMAAAQRQHSGRPRQDQGYVEMQIHGAVDLRRDVKKLRLHRDHAEASKHLPGIPQFLAMATALELPVSWRGVYAPDESRDRALAKATQYGWNITSWSCDENKQDSFACAQGRRAKDAPAPSYTTHSCIAAELTLRLADLGARGVDLVGVDVEAGSYTFLGKESGGHGQAWDYGLMARAELSTNNGQGWQTCGYAAKDRARPSEPLDLVLMRRPLQLSNSLPVVERVVSLSAGFFDDAYSDGKHLGDVRAIWSLGWLKAHEAIIATPGASRSSDQR